MEIQEIKLFMKNKGITQIELAEKSQIPLTTIRYIFSGRTQTPRIDTMQAIEKACLESNPGDTIIILGMGSETWGEVDASRNLYIGDKDFIEMVKLKIR